jgi:NADH-quinone oxidoreductase subunit L
MLFVGAIGKSAQFPLFVWLPDAMAGPTPVSALIHAATMVTAGVYLLCRINPILEASYDWLPTLVAWTGAVTALLAATIAVAQHDIKKVLAYSTVSQLGYMFMAVGLGAYWVAIFHMITHAFFKACLFLGSGSVIHGMHENQDMRVMGALRKLMPLTSATFLLSWLAIAGVPPLSGFFSKDEILAFAYQESPALYAVGLLVAVLTAYYMSRQVFLVFFGEPRWEQVLHGAASPAPVGDLPGSGDGEQTAEGALSPQQRAAASLGVDVDDFHELPEGFHPHESPWTMTVPLVVLAGLALVGGALNLPLVEDAFFLEHWLAPVFEESATHLTLGDGMVVALLVIGALAAAAGGLAAWAVYLAGRAPKIEPRLAAEGWRIDSTLASVVAGPGTAAFEALATVDRVVIDGAVNGVGAGVLHAGQAVRGVQDGQLRRYAALVGAGGVLVVAAMLAQAVL